MSNQCTGLTIQDEGELTEFGEKLADYHKENHNQRVLLGGLSSKQRANEASEELGIPTQCPHEPYNKETNLCIFHLSKSQKKNLGIAPEEVNHAFVQAVEDEQSLGTNAKNFVNSNIRDLDLQYLDLDSPDNQPIDLRFARVGNFCLDQTVLHEKIRFNHGKINGFECRNSVLLSGLDAEAAEINENNLTVTNNQFGEAVNFNDSQFFCQRVWFEDNIFQADLSFVNAAIWVEEPTEINADPNEKDVSFNGSEFKGNADFSQIGIKSTKHHTGNSENSIPVKNIKITLRYCDYSGDSVSFDNAEFGTWSVTSGALGRNHRLNDTDELSTISFTKSDFSESNVDFSASLLGGDVELPDSDFSRAAIDMDNAIIAGDLVVTDAKFSDKTVDFYKLEVRGNLDFGNSIFDENKKIRFEKCSVKLDAVFNDVIYKSKEIDFQNFNVNGQMTFENSQLQSNKINMSDINIGKTVSFERSTLIGQTVDFSAVVIGAGTRFESSHIECERLKFSGAKFGGETDFSFAEFKARSTSFDQSTFNGAVAFAHADFDGRVTFEGTHFDSNKINFTEVDAEDADLRFIGTRTISNRGNGEESTVIDFSKATIPEGRFEQPESSGTYYDFTEATIGDLELMFHDESSDSDQLFEYFRFFETEFDGFDFSRSIYRKEFKENGWRLESVGVNKEIDTSVAERSFIGDLRSLVAKPGQKLTLLCRKYWRLLREGSNPDTDINELESTYRKAKIGADKQGDSDASSKFFQKELQFRRLSHGQQAWLWKTEELKQTPTPWERIRRAWLWFTNWILWMTSGYGEKPKRVIVSSVVVIMLFMMAYEVAWATVEVTRPEQLRGLLGSFTLSSEMFTAIILGGSEVESESIRIISYIEGFIGSFFIALFVLTITRSVRR